MNLNSLEIKKTKTGEQKAEIEKTETRRRRSWSSAETAKHGEISEVDLYCVDQPGPRILRRTRGTGKFFENLTWLTADEAAEYLRLPSVGMLRVLVCKREIPFHKLGRRLRFKKMDLDRLLEASRKGGL